MEEKWKKNGRKRGRNRNFLLSRENGGKRNLSYAGIRVTQGF